MKFPEYFPSRCPPADCSKASGTFYRTIRGSVPVKKDFLPPWQLYPRKQREWNKKGKACQACGLSVNANIEDLIRKQETVPSIRGKIVKGTLEPKTGKIKSTPTMRDSSHHTWWVADSINDPSIFFKVVA